MSENKMTGGFAFLGKNLKPNVNLQCYNCILHMRWPILTFLISGVTLGNKCHMLKGKTFLVTGSTDGIGQHTALLLAKSGTEVLLHGRNWDRLQKTKKFIYEQLDPEI